MCVWRAGVFRMPWWFVVKASGVPLGLGRRALDEVAELAATKLVMPEFVLLKDRQKAELARLSREMGDKTAAQAAPKPS